MDFACISEYIHPTYIEATHKATEASFVLKHFPSQWLSPFSFTLLLPPLFFLFLLDSPIPFFFTRLHGQLTVSRVSGRMGFSPCCHPAGASGRECYECYIESRFMTS
eukprot:GHVU01089193.1.p1 GENE.GHVU01089193.1~~GHVU01089193.1.p1  ORF type:complete len:107 (+),score=0.97 GHVU01089193.1:120-440(+)